MYNGEKVNEGRGGCLPRTKFSMKGRVAYGIRRAAEDLARY